jgi:hypothetical protein
MKMRLISSLLLHVGAFKVVHIAFGPVKMQEAHKCLGHSYNRHPDTDVSG